LEVTYLLNSGFVVRVDDVLLVFDAFDDPAGVLSDAVERGDYDRLYFFASQGIIQMKRPRAEELLRRCLSPERG